MVGRSVRTDLVSQEAERRHSWGIGGPARCPIELRKAASSYTPHECVGADRHKESLCLGVDERPDWQRPMPSPSSGRTFLKACGKAGGRNLRVDALRTLSRCCEPASPGS